MASPNVNYNSLQEAGAAEDEENEDTPRNSGIMIHIVPETSKARWNHIENLDSFFTRMYNYHQKHGFVVIVCDEVLQLIGLGFVVWLLTFAVHCIRYPILFGDEKPSNVTSKVTISDVVIPFATCISDFGFWTYIVLTASFLFFLLRMIKVLYHIAEYADIRKFYNTALKINDTELDNITWHEVQKKIREVQSEQHMCIDKEQLTELDIYHRILRFKNYMVALMNKNLLPSRFTLPIFGEVVSLSRGLIYNIEFILFRGPWSPFENNWQLRDDYAVRSNQVELAHRLSRQIMWIALANLLLSPFIFLWQVIYFSFGYVAILRKEPGSVGVRTWSNYGRLYLRHFNELDHELDARLNRAYEPADKYMSSFSSPLMAVIAKNLLFITGGMLILILSLGIYDEFVFQIEHVLAITTILTLIGVGCRILMPDENLIWCPEQLLTGVLAHVHYLPTDWRNNAHTTQVRKEFEHFFQFKAMYLLNEIFSPIMTPYILMFVFRPRAVEIVKFFRSFTVSVKGVGNVCSFAQMDVRKHGNPEWQIATASVVENVSPNDDQEQLQLLKQPVENGKTELSLVHFTLTNPEWKMPPDAQHFMKGIRQNALQDLVAARATEKSGDNSTAMTQSLMSFGSIGEEYSSIAHNVFNTHNIANSTLGRSVFQTRRQPGFNAQTTQPGPSYAANSGQGYDFEQMLQQNLGDVSSTPHRDVLHDITEADEEDAGAAVPQVFSASAGNLLERSYRKMGVRRSEGRLEGPNDSLLYSIYGMNPHMAANPTDITTADMCLSTLYLHELHHRQKKRNSRTGQSQRIWQRSHNPNATIVTAKPAERTPLLGTKRS